MSSDSTMETVERIRETCLRVLEHRPHSRFELLTKLRRRGYPDHATNQVLDRLVEVGLLDDEAFAKAWVESRQRRRPQGKRGLRSELMKRGIASDTIAAVLQDALEHEDPVSAACRAIQSKAAQLRALPVANAQRKASQFLIRRGFDHETVRTAVERILQG